MRLFKRDVIILKSKKNKILIVSNLEIKFFYFFVAKAYLEKIPPFATLFVGISG